MTEEHIIIEEEEVVHKAESNGTDWTEEFTVAGTELIDNLMRLAKEATVRRIMVKNSEQEVILDLPLVVGVSTMLLFSHITMFGLAIAFVANYSIVVERQATAEDAPEEEEEEIPIAFAQCQGLTKAGTQCKRKPVDGSSYCIQHQPA